MRFSYHAQYRLHTRKFSVEKMKQTILHPDFTEYCDDGKIVSVKRFEEGTLRVIYGMNRNTHIIISVYYIN